MMHMRSRRAKIVGWIAICMASILIVLAAGVVAAVRLEIGGITQVPRIDIGHRPPRYTNALNLLLLGSDTRAGHNAAIGGRTGCNCSDTILLAHISPGHHTVVVVSIPRDTVVPLYRCSPWRGTPGQQANPYAVERINATLAAGGPECVRETVEQQTGIFINDVAQLDFVGFQRVINDIGGVNICLPFAINNVITSTGGSGLHLSAGRHHIWGRVALQFWRTRYNVANGSDISRIARDQYMLAQIVKGVLHSGLLHNPAKILSVIRDAANSLTTDASYSELLHIATSLNGISSKDVQFITAPWVSYPPDPNEVEFAQPQADAVFWALAHDTALPATGKGKVVATASFKGPLNGPIQDGPAGALYTLVPSQVKVMVLNGSSRQDKAPAVAAGLSSRGFDVLGTGYAPTTGHHNSVILYGHHGDLPAARTLREQFTGASIRLVRGVPRGTVEVVTGSRFTKLAAPRPTSRTSIASMSHDYGGITASVSCRNRAFYASNGVPAGQARACPCR